MVLAVVVETEVRVPDTQEVEKEAEQAAEMMMETSEKAPEESQQAEAVDREAAQASAAGDLEGVQSTKEVDEEEGREEEGEDGQAVHATQEVDEEVGREEVAIGGQATETTDQEKEVGREEEAEAELVGEAAEDERMEDQVTDLTVDQPEEFEEMETVPIIEVVGVDDDDLQMITLQEALAIPVPTPPMGTRVDAPQVSRRRRRLLMDEPEEEEDNDDGEERLLLAKKRKGQELAGPAQKKIRPPSQAVTIREPSPTAYDTPLSAER